MLFGTKMTSEKNPLILDDSIVNNFRFFVITNLQRNGVERDSLKVHIIDKRRSKRFAMPDNHLVVYTGLIKECKTSVLLEFQVAEIAHIEGNHVMKKVVERNWSIGFIIDYNGFKWCGFK